MGDTRGGGKNPILEESKGPERQGKFLILGSRRDGGQMGVVDFAADQGTADAQAAVLARTGWATVEVYTRVSEHKRA